MKCPICGEWSTVLETRGDRRRRECANEHRFSTKEVLSTEMERLVQVDGRKARYAAGRANLIHLGYLRG